MRVAKLVAPQKIEIFNEPFSQKPGKTQAVVQVRAVGICGTDLHIFKGERADVALPRIMGHELSGIVKEVGSEVSHLVPGDHVVFDPVVACGQCKTCLSGHQNVCPDVCCFGVQMDGGFQDYIVVDSANLYPISKSISFQEAALAEPYSVGANILAKSKATAQSCVVILGAGTIGLAVLQTMKTTGAKVLISDIVDEKLELAQKCGADRVVNSKTQDLGEAIKAFFPDGADVLIDAVGITPLTQQVIDFAAPTAHIVVISFDNRPLTVPPVNITKKELTITGSRMNCNNFPQVITWMEEGYLNTKDMITNIYPLERIQEAFETTLNNPAQTTKTIILF